MVHLQETSHQSCFKHRSLGFLHNRKQALVLLRRSLIHQESPNFSTPRPKVKQEQPIIRHYKNRHKLKFLWNFSYLVHLFLKIQKSQAPLKIQWVPQNARFPEALLHDTNLLVKTYVIPDTLIFPKKKKDFTNELIPITIKSIFRNTANLFKAPASRRKKWYESEITVFYF